jgi:hypothetical protein
MVDYARLLKRRAQINFDQYASWATRVATVKWIEKDARGARNRHSDKEKFCSDLNRPKSCEMSERLENIAKIRRLPS